MTRLEMERVPELVKSGKFTWEQAIREMSVFITQNKGLFMLFKYDDDFISEVVIEFLDRGPEALSQYNPRQGNFFSFTFCFVKNICNGIIKRKTIKNVMEYYTVSESILNYDDKVEQYSKIRPEDFERPKVPFNYKPIPGEAFQIAIKSEKYHITKLKDAKILEIPMEIREKLKDFSPRIIYNMIIIMALRSSYYLKDDYIKNITQMFNIDYESFHDVLLKINSEIEDKENTRKIMETRRNRAYFQHKRIRDQIQYNKDVTEDYDYESEYLNKKYTKSTEKWNNLNKKMEEGKACIRPTTKIIAKVLGISTRQVTYYQSLARKIGQALDKKKKKSKKKAQVKKGQIQKEPAKKEQLKLDSLKKGQFKKKKIQTRKKKTQSEV